MSHNHENDHAQPLSGDPSPEELEAAQAANEHSGVGDLQAQLHELTLKNAELGELYLRAQAEMQNTPRRAEEDISKSRKFAVESFADAMLPVIDSLEAGLAIREATPQQIREGAELTLRQLRNALERNKVIEINPEQGAKFDPHHHQAISVVALPPGSPQDPNTIVTVLQKGYSISERTLRPALVTVSASR